MPTLTDLASRYRWELMLFIGIPLIEQSSWWLLPHILGNFNIAFDVWSLSPYLAPFLNISLLLLGFFYFRVRGLGRATLSLMWTFALVYEAAATATYLLFEVTDPERSSVVSAFWWSMGLTLIPQVMVLAWFARQASKISFNHTLVLIGLATTLDGSGLLMPNLVFARFLGGPIAWGFVVLALAVKLFAVWVLSRLDAAREAHETDTERWTGRWDIPVFGVSLRRLVVRVLPRFDPAGGSYREVILTLFGLNWLLHVYITMRSMVAQDHEIALLVLFSVIGITSWPLTIALVIALAYAVRVRQPPEHPSTTEPKTTT